MSDGQTATATKSGAPDPLIGRVIADRFRITNLIARGGMGKVYRAEQTPLGRACAVKVLNPNYNGDADPEFHRRFFREASITSRITHPNSVTIFDYGKTDDDVYFMAMEYLEGQTLHLALREGGTMHEERVGRIAQQICRALREAHALDVIHRDLKPANIFLTRHGDDEDFVKVLDFGLVKHLSERPEEQLTQTGLFMGSPKYMAPEQIQGGHVDPRTDIYSLGIMMYEMLTGKVPFERATSVNILMAHVGEPPPPMREVKADLICSPAFEELVMRCIAKDPAERYTTMDEVLQAIKRVHNVSLTGQLSAVSASGAYIPVQTAPPPPMVPTGSGGFQAASGSHRVAVSGSHTPVGLQTTVDGLSDSGAGALEQPPRRSRAWLGLGVVAAAVVGGLLGLAALRISSGGAVSVPARPAAPQVTAPPEPVPVPSSPSSPQTGASAGATAAASSAVAESRSATVRVSTDPPGASVREDASELCAATPCDVTWTGEAADPQRAHKLVLSRPGFRTDVHVVKPGDAPLAVKLYRSASAPGRPAQAAPAQPAQPSPPPKTEPASPNGFKDLPY